MQKPFVKTYPLEFPLCLAEIFCAHQCVYIVLRFWGILIDIFDTDADSCLSSGTDLFVYVSDNLIYRILLDKETMCDFFLIFHTKLLYVGGLQYGSDDTRREKLWICQGIQGPTLRIRLSLCTEHRVNDSYLRCHCRQSLVEIGAILVKKINNFWSGAPMSVFLTIEPLNVGSHARVI